MRDRTDFQCSYNDDEAAASGPAAPAVPDQVAPAPTLAAHTADATDDYNHGQDQGGEAYTRNNEEIDEDDDEVDFNLGNGTTHHVDTPTYHNAPSLSAAPTKGPNAKEDG